MDRWQIAWVNQRHITEESLDKDITWIINVYSKFILPKYWGTGKSVLADGIHPGHPHEKQVRYPAGSPALSDFSGGNQICKILILLSDIDLFGVP